MKWKYLNNIFKYIGDAINNRKKNVINTSVYKVIYVVQCNSSHLNTYFQIHAFKLWKHSSQMAVLVVNIYLSSIKILFKWWSYKNLKRLFSFLTMFQMIAELLCNLLVWGQFEKSPTAPNQHSNTNYCGWKMCSKQSFKIMCAPVNNRCMVLMCQCFLDTHWFF